MSFQQIKNLFKSKAVSPIKKYPSTPLPKPPVIKQMIKKDWKTYPPIHPPYPKPQAVYTIKTKDGRGIHTRTPPVPKGYKQLREKQSRDNQLRGQKFGVSTVHPLTIQQMIPKYRLEAAMARQQRLTKDLAGPKPNYVKSFLDNRTKPQRKRPIRLEYNEWRGY